MSRWALRRAPPVSRKIGSPFGPFTTSMSCQPTRSVMPDPSAFAHASLAAKRRAK
jgi:hypothetical protein